MPKVPELVKGTFDRLADMTHVQHKVVKISPFGAQDFSVSGNRNITFRLPRDHILVPKKSYFMFKVSTNGKLMENVQTIFDNYRVSIGAQEIVNENEWGWWKALEFNAKACYCERNSVNAYIMNVPEHYTSNQTTKFRIPFCSQLENNIWSALEGVPLYKCDQFEIQYTINNTLSDYVLNGSTLTVTNAELELYLVDSPVLREMFSRDIVKNFRTFQTYHATVGSNASQIAHNIPCSFQNLRGLAVVQRPTSVVTASNWEGSASNLDAYKYTHSLCLNSINNVNVTIDGKQIPEKNLDTTNQVETVNHLERFWNDLDYKNNTLGSWHDSNIANNTEGKGYIALGFSVDPHDVSGASLITKSGTIVFNATCTATQDTDVDYFMPYDKFIKISADGSVSLTK